MGENEIRFCRMSKGMTQAALAKAVGVTQQAIAKWETEATSVSIEYLPKLEKALGIRKEVIFPGLKPKSQKMENEVAQETVDLITPHEIVLHFNNREESYYATISSKEARRLRTRFSEHGEDPVWFNTNQGMIVAVNPSRLRMVEIGQDLCDLPEKQIEPQRLGERDEDFEVNGDDRYLRMFLERKSDPIIEYPNVDSDSGALEVLDEILSGCYGLDPFVSFYSSSDDEAYREIFFRPSDLELIECPLSVYEEYAERSRADD